MHFESMLLFLPSTLVASRNTMRIITAAAALTACTIVSGISDVALISGKPLTAVLFEIKQVLLPRQAAQSNPSPCQRSCLPHGPSRKPGL